MLANDDTRTNSPTPIDQNAAIQPPTPTYRTDISHSRSERSNNGTSPALSTQSANWDSMKPGDTNTTQSTFTDLSANATTASGLPSSQEQMDAPTPTLEEQRTRITTSKETSSQQSATSTVLSGSPRSTNVQAASRAPEVTAIRLTPEVASVRDASRTVNITVELASGQTAQASVRERAGSVDVKIVTPTAASAQRVSSEMEGARQNLDAAGIKLGHSDISYQRGDGGRRENEGYRPPAQAQSASEKEVFIMNEVVQ